jgi:hypothetical protein
MRRKRPSKLTEAEERKAWAELPKPPPPARAYTEAEDRLILLPIHAKETNIDTDAAAHNPTRSELELALQRVGLSKNERAVVLAVVCDRLASRVEIARETGLHRHTIQNILRRKPVRQCLIDLSKGNPPSPSGATESHPWPASGGERAGDVPNLSDAMRHAKTDLANYPLMQNCDLFYMTAGLKELKLPNTASSTEQIVAYIGIWPGLLLNPNTSQRCSTVLANLLEKARYGSKSESAWARIVLATLTRGSPGGRCAFPEPMLQRRLTTICIRIAELREAWRASFGETKSSRRLQIRRAIGIEEKTFPDAELDLLLKDEVPVLTAAARVARRATGIGLNVWKRAGKKSPLLLQYR